MEQTRGLTVLVPIEFVDYQNVRPHALDDFGHGLGLRVVAGKVGHQLTDAVAVERGVEGGHPNGLRLPLTAAHKATQCQSANHDGRRDPLSRHSYRSR